MGSVMVIDSCGAATAGAEAFNAHDLEAMAEVLDERVVFRAPGEPVALGRNACLAYFQSWFEDFPDAHVDVHDVHVIGDVAVEQGTLTGTHTGRAATGRAVALDYVQVSRLRHGRRVALELTFDRLLMLEQLGLAGPAA